MLFMMLPKVHDGSSVIKVPGLVSYKCFGVIKMALNCYKLCTVITQ